MTGPFERVGDGYRLRLRFVERSVLRSVPGILDTGGDAGGRLDYTAHPDEPSADRRYRELVAGSLDELRSDDRAGFRSVVAGDPVSPDQIEAFLRVVGEARIILAARLGIEEDGWEYGASPGDPDMALLGWLGWLQESAVAVLSELL